MKVLLIITGLFWVLWAFLVYSANNIDKWTNESRRELIATKRRMKITDHLTEHFEVNYSEPHIVGLTFDDNKLSDSLGHYIGYYTPPDLGFSVKWILYEGEDSLAGGVWSNGTGSSGKTISFGRFEASTWSEYMLDLQILSVPSFVVEDSAWLVIEVGRAVVSVGNELSYGLAKMAVNFLKAPVFWISVGLTLIYTYLWGRVVLKRANGE